jgi:hypothetical protein
MGKAQAGQLHILHSLYDREPMTKWVQAFLEQE